MVGNTGPHWDNSGISSTPPITTMHPGIVSHLSLGNSEILLGNTGILGITGILLDLESSHQTGLSENHWDSGNNWDNVGLRKS